jgi:hypothetical protein
MPFDKPDWSSLFHIGWFEIFESFGTVKKLKLRAPAISKIGKKFQSEFRLLANLSEKGGLLESINLHVASVAINQSTTQY